MMQNPEGAKVLAGGTYNADADKGCFFVNPTVDQVTDDMDIMHEETFGPVAPITTYTEIDEAISLANDTPFGLAAYFSQKTIAVVVHCRKPEIWYCWLERRRSICRTSSIWRYEGKRRRP